MASIDIRNLDDWAGRFFDEMLAERLSVSDFEQAVSANDCRGAVFGRAPATAARLRALTESWGDSHEAGYGAAPDGARFRSQWLVGKHGIPGAVHIVAPPEHRQIPGLAGLNRPLHRHDSGRIGLITAGQAVFHFMVRDADRGWIVIDCPVGPGDMVFWPAWTPHTFDACDGFSVLSAMAVYVSPREDGFVFPLSDDTPAPDSLARLGLDGSRVSTGSP